jgi:hypothetical protein
MVARLPRPHRRGSSDKVFTHRTVAVWETAGHGEGVRDSPERRGYVEAERSGGAVGFCGGGGRPASSGGFLVVL